MAEFRVQETVIGPRDCRNTIAVNESDLLLKKMLILDGDLFVSHSLKLVFPSEQVRRTDTLAIKIPICLSVALSAYCLSYKLASWLFFACRCLENCKFVQNYGRLIAI